VLKANTIEAKIQI